MAADLHGKTSAENRIVGASGTVEIGEFMLSTAGTGGIADWKGRLALPVIPQIYADTMPAHLSSMARQDFKSFGDLQGRHNANDGANDPFRVAGGDHPRGWRCFVDTSQTGGVPGQNRKRHALRRHTPAIDPGNGILYGIIVHEKAGVKIVGGVEDHVESIQQPVDCGGVDVVHHAFDSHKGIYGLQFPLGGNRLG